MKTIMIEKIRADIKTAMKVKDTPRKDTLKWAVTKAQAFAKTEKVEMDDEHMFEGVKAELKELKDSLKTMSKKLSDEEIKEYNYKIAVLVEYMPKQLSKDVVEIKVNEAIKTLGVALEMKSMGKVMGYLKEALGDTVDPGMLSGVVKSKLTQ